MQGKRRDQIEFSYKVCAIGMVCMVAIIVALSFWRIADTPPRQYETEQWIPTEQDLIWIDSLQTQVKDIEQDVNELNVSVTRIDRKLDGMIEDRLEYKDGTYDSIRYYKGENGVMIDPIYTDEERLWITAEGDTIYE